MSYDDFLVELSKARLSVRDFADLVGMRPNSVSNNAKQGKVPSHLAIIATLLSELRSNGIPFEPVFHRVAVDRKKSRGASAAGKFGGNKQGQLELGS